MRTAQTVLTVIQERGKQHKPIERVYKLLFNREFYLNAYAKLYPNSGAMTKGVTQRYRKFRYGKAHAGLLKGIFPNTLTR